MAAPQRASPLVPVTQSGPWFPYQAAQSTSIGSMPRQVARVSSSMQTSGIEQSRGAVRHPKQASVSAHPPASSAQARSSSRRTGSESTAKLSADANAHEAIFAVASAVRSASTTSSPHPKSATSATVSRDLMSAASSP
jgi:hypothetical protein